jgi:hypothetical protein
VGTRIEDDRCSGCSAALAPAAATCGGCGGALRGTIAHANDRLDAEEALVASGSERAAQDADRDADRDPESDADGDAPSPRG